MSLDPQVISTKEAWTYCGGRLIFEELRAAHPTLITPFRRTAGQGKTYYLRSIIDTALKAAQLSQELVHDAVVKAVDAGNAVTDAEHRADALHATILAESLDFLFEDGGYFGGSEIHGVWGPGCPGRFR